MLRYINFDKRRPEFGNKLLIKFGKKYLLPEEIKENGIVLSSNKNVEELLSIAFQGYKKALDEKISNFEKIDKKILKRWGIKL